MTSVTRWSSCVRRCIRHGHSCQLVPTQTIPCSRSVAVKSQREKTELWPCALIDYRNIVWLPCWAQWFFFNLKIVCKREENKYRKRKEKGEGLWNFSVSMKLQRHRARSQIPPYGSRRSDPAGCHSYFSYLGEICGPWSQTGLGSSPEWLLSCLLTLSKLIYLGFSCRYLYNSNNNVYTAVFVGIK